MADLLGWLGCICFALCGVPQAWRSYKDGHSLGLTYSFIVLWLGGEVFYISGTLLKFGWVDWIMWNCMINTVAILVIGYYRIWPRSKWYNWTTRYSLVNKDELIEQMRAAYRAMIFRPPLENSTNLKVK